MVRRSRSFIELELPLPASVLVVEDNTIIALDTEEQLLDLGVERVDVAASNAAALAALERENHHFALLDFNLGNETSEPVARALDERGIRFAFATGYGEVDALAGRYANKIAVLFKPYSRNDLVSVLRLSAAG
ncbi:MAG: response regulator [Novosphingobium sp.]|nr:response regulator [Novosphingobium sp.]